LLLNYLPKEEPLLREGGHNLLLMEDLLLKHLWTGLKHLWTGLIFLSP
jgi:hypothetical protein